MAVSSRIRERIYKDDEYATWVGEQIVELYGLEPYEWSEYEDYDSYQIGGGVFSAAGVARVVMQELG